MRGIQFRGKRIDFKEWVYGYLIGDNVIVGNIVEFNDEYFNTSFWYKVRPETVGQFTGLKDKNKIEIYEGDIVSAKHLGKATITFTDGMFKAGTVSLCTYTNGLMEFRCEVVGNIYETAVMDS